MSSSLPNMVLKYNDGLVNAYSLHLLDGEHIKKYIGDVL